jgi:hypothetical protein
VGCDIQGAGCGDLGWPELGGTERRLLLPVAVSHAASFEEPGHPLA